MRNLVIVESPTKAKTISKFLSRDYLVESSFGHVRDLPVKTMGIDIKNNFEPTYVIPAKAQKIATKLTSLAKKAGNVFFATDEDREGEAIAWHLKNILKPKNYQRITFHEITKQAIEAAIKNPREIDINLVNAQQARRILDRLVGYELSPFLWKKVAKGLSAGRVQSVAVRLVVEREREIEKFKSEEYWTIKGVFKPEAETQFEAELFSSQGATLKKFDINTETKAQRFVADIQKFKYHVANIQYKETKKKVPEPFRTSTLQQTANNKLGFSSKETMVIAQQLYEGIDLKDKGAVGLITYMRTDSLNLSNDYLTSAREYIIKTLGQEYAAKEIRRFKTKSKSAQEAHEAIRPTHVSYDPDSIKSHLTPQQFKLYNLIWRCTLATQMAEAQINNTTIDISAEKNEYSFRSTGQTIKFLGFLKIYISETKELILPKLKEKQSLDLLFVTPEQHFTQPPARYTEASLIKVLEEYGIGRPSTYAPTLSTIEERRYVIKEEKKFKPTDIGLLVNDLLVKHFPQIVDYQFTAKMEHDLDEIAETGEKWQPIIEKFYTPFKANLKKKTKELDKKEITEEKTNEKCDKCGAPMVIKTGRYGRFLACSNYPGCKNTKKLGGEGGEPKELELIEEKCEKCGAPLAIRQGRFGKFYSCSRYPECDYIKSFSQNTGIKCPKCGEGDIVSRRGRRSKTFYACNNYPKCKFVLWGKPTGEKCPTCNSLIIYAGKEKTKCSNAECPTNPKKQDKQDQ